MNTDLQLTLSLYPAYKRLTSLLAPVWRAVIKKRVKKGKECPNRYTEKYAKTSVPPKQTNNLIWIHGASVGESQSALILINRLSELFPDLQILMTTGTLTSASLMEKKLPQNAIHQFYPIDTPDTVEKFLNHWNPNCVLWMESELWPNMLHEIKQRNLPCFLINARISDKSFRFWKKIPTFTQNMLSTFSSILCQTDSDKEKFTALGHKSCITTDNIKYSATPLPCDKDKLKRLLNAIHDRPIWVYASTHEPEEKIACDIHTSLKQHYPDLLTIIVPRHPERRDSIIETMATYQHLSYELRSTQTVQTPGKNTDIYVADTLGELGLFYRISPISFIGRSFSSDGGGGHNPIEALQLGSVVIHGPKVQNLQEIFDALHERNLCFQANDPADVSAILNDLFSNQRRTEVLQNKSVSYTREKRAVVDNVIKILVPTLESIGIRTLPARKQAVKNAV